MSNEIYRQLPGVDRLLKLRPVADLVESESYPVVLNACRRAIDDARAAISAGLPPPTLAQLAEDVERLAALAQRLPLCTVINATGVVLHTNLGRAPLSDDALAAMSAASGRFSNLEYDLESGERGSRHGHLESLLNSTTGAEAGFAVNNNAGAVLLCLATFAANREVVVSRGQAVEIGGGFRIPDVLRQSGCRLVEVGTTNRTTERDYFDAITSDTALLLHVHSSNFRMVGFTHEVSGPDLARLGASKGIAVLDDVGSGALIDTSAFEMEREPLVQESVEAGASLVCFSGDKLLGGPQAGIIVGRAEYVERVRRHPLARALRADKACIAGLAATLRHYVRGEALRAIPVWRMIALSRPELEDRAELWRSRLAARGVIGHLLESRSTVGGGSLPGETLPTVALMIDPADSPRSDSASAGAEAVARRLRLGTPAVVARVERGVVVLDPRTVLPGEDDDLIACIEAALRD